MDKEHFGKFVAELRKEKNMTQRELGEKLNLTDKAISKWERGLSYPDICVLNDLSELLDISVVELLDGKRAEEETMSKEQVQELIDYSFQISDEEIERRKEKSRLIITLCIVIIMLFFSIGLNIYNYIKLQKKMSKAPYYGYTTEQSMVMATEDYGTQINEGNIMIDPELQGGFQDAE